MGVPGMGTTFIQTINVSNLGIGSSGGRTNYTIKVEKRDASDRIYMHITGKDGSTVSFAGTDILSEAGVASGYQAYSGGFDFGGTLTSLIVEVGGRDINLSIGPLFDDVTVNVLWNVISTIVLEQITTIESFVSLGIFDQETIDVATNVFENNNISIGPGGQTDIQPNIEENVENMPSYETVQMEMEIEMPDMEFSSSMDMPAPDTSIPEVEAEMSVNMEMEMEMESPAPEPMETAGPEKSMDEEASSPGPNKTDEPTEEIKPESLSVDSPSEDNESEVVENKSAPKKEIKAESKKVTKTKQEKKQAAKQKAAKKILKKMGDKRKYDNVNQIKTLIVMQVLGNTKDFFSAQKLIPQPEGFFTQTRIPDATISDNNYNQYFMFGGSDAAHNELIESQYRR
jgi:hypothetical protein